MPKGRTRAFDRDEALNRAVAVFWEHGYDATSIALLTEAMGIGAPSLYAAFGDKRALFYEALDRYLNTYAAFSVRAVTGEEAAHEAIARLLHDAAAAYTGAGHPPGCLLITAATNCTPSSADVRGRLRGLRAQGRLALEQKIAAAVHAGELPAGTDARALATFYAAILQGMSAQARDGATRTDLDAIAAAALQAWPSPTSRWQLPTRAAAVGTRTGKPGTGSGRSDEALAAVGVQDGASPGTVHAEVVPALVHLGQRAPAGRRGLPASGEPGVGCAAAARRGGAGVPRYGLDAEAGLRARQAGRRVRAYQDPGERA
jgi:AcrR family transcriptional regulator